MEALANGQRPTITIDDDVEVIDLDCYIKPSEEIVKLWDERVRRVVFEEQIYQKERGLNICLKEYIRSLERESSIFEDKLLLKKKILSHIEFISLCYSDVCLKTIETAQYLDDMVEILTYYCNLELRCARRFKRKKNGSVDSDKKFIMEKWKSIAEHMCMLLTFYLMNSQKHIFHVLIKVNYDIKSRACQAIMDAVYWHFMIILPQTDDTEEGFCRYYLVLQKWKRIRENEKYIMDIERSNGVMEQRFPRLCFQKALKDIFFPNKLNSVAIFSIIKNELEYYIKCYFNYIKNKEIVESDTSDFDLILDTIEVIEIQDDRNQQDEDIEFVSRTAGDAILISDEEDNQDMISNLQDKHESRNHNLDRITQSHFNFDLTTNLSSQDTLINTREDNLLSVVNDKERCDATMEVEMEPTTGNNSVGVEKSKEQKQKSLNNDLEIVDEHQEQINKLQEMQHEEIVVKDDQVMMGKQKEKLTDVPAKTTEEKLAEKAVLQEKSLGKQLAPDKSKDSNVLKEMEVGVLNETVKEKWQEKSQQVTENVVEESDSLTIEKQPQSSEDTMEKLSNRTGEKPVERIVQKLAQDKNLKEQKVQENKESLDDMTNKIQQEIETENNILQEIVEKKQGDKTAKTSLPKEKVLQKSAEKKKVLEEIAEKQQENAKLATGKFEENQTLEVPKNITEKLAKKQPKMSEKKPMETSKNFLQEDETNFDFSRVVIEEYHEEEPGKEQEVEMDIHAQARELEELCRLADPAVFENVIFVATEPVKISMEGKENLLNSEKNVVMDATVCAVPYEIEIVANADEFSSFTHDVGEKKDGEKNHVSSTPSKTDILKVAWDDAISDDASSTPVLTKDSEIEDHSDSNHSTDNFLGFERGSVNRQDQNSTNNNKPPTLTGILKKPNSTKRKLEHSVTIEKTSKRFAREHPRERPRMLAASLEVYGISQRDITMGNLRLPHFTTEELATKHRMHLERKRRSHVIRSRKNALENGLEKKIHGSGESTERNPVLVECDRLKLEEMQRRQTPTLIKFDYKKQTNNGTHSGATTHSPRTVTPVRRKHTEKVDNTTRRRTENENYSGSHKKARDQHEQSQTGDPRCGAGAVQKAVGLSRKRGNSVRRNNRTNSLSSAESSGSTKT